MSLYNMVCGFNPACVVILPMLGRQSSEYPRFRDCFISEDGRFIDIYTRVGGGNRGNGYGEDELYKDPNFESTFDDPYDRTYATYRFNVPDKWKDDFNHIISGEYEKVSDEYVDVVKGFYPKLAESKTIDMLFKRMEMPEREEPSKAKSESKTVTVKCANCKYLKSDECINESSSRYGMKREPNQKCKNFEQSEE